MRQYYNYNWKLSAIERPDNRSMVYSDQKTTKLETDLWFYKVQITDLQFCADQKTTICY